MNETEEKMVRQEGEGRRGDVEEKTEAQYLTTSPKDCCFVLPPAVAVAVAASEEE